MYDNGEIKITVDTSELQPLIDGMERIGRERIRMWWRVTLPQLLLVMAAACIGGVAGSVVL